MIHVWFEILDLKIFEYDFFYEWLPFLFQSVKEQAYDYHSAIYHLLQDKFKKHPKTIQKTIVPQNLPLAVSTERRSSITTGVGM